jgi:hypothetical protein
MWKLQRNSKIEERDTPNISRSQYEQEDISLV